MKGKAIIPLVLGLCVGLVAVKLLIDTLKKAQASNAAKNSITAVQAKQDIDAYTLITAEMVEEVQTADNKFAPTQDRIAKKELAIGRVTAKAIPQFAPVLASMLAPEGTPAGMEGRIPAGFRAVSVEIDEVSGVAYQLKPNDWVDVIVVMDVDAGGGRRAKETIAEVILQHVQVAAIGQATTGKPGDGASKVKAAKSATLLVPEEDVPKLHLAGTRGKITLAMRGDDTNIMKQGPGTRLSDILSTLREEKARDAEAAAAAALQQQQIAAKTMTPQQLALASEPDGPQEPPFGVVVYHGSPYPAAYPQTVQRLMFEHKDSSTIIELGDTPVNQGKSMMKVKGPTRQQPGLPAPSRPIKNPELQLDDDDGAPSTGKESKKS